MSNRDFLHLKDFAPLWELFRQSISINARQIVLGDQSGLNIDNSNPNVKQVLTAMNLIESAQLEAAGIVNQTTGTRSSIPRNGNDMSISILAVLRRRHLCVIFLLLCTFAHGSCAEFFAKLKHFLWHPDPIIRRWMTKTIYHLLYTGCMLQFELAFTYEPATDNSLIFLMKQVQFNPFPGLYLRLTGDNRSEFSYEHLFYKLPKPQFGEMNIQVLSKVKATFKEAAYHIFSTIVVESMGEDDSSLGSSSEVSSLRKLSFKEEELLSSVADILMDQNATVMSTTYEGTVHTFNPDFDLATIGDCNDLDNLVDDSFRKVFEKQEKLLQSHSQKHRRKQTTEHDCFALWELVLSDTVCPSDIASVNYLRATAHSILQEPVFFWFLYSLKDCPDKEVRIRGLEEIRKLLLSSPKQAVCLLGKINWQKVLTMLLFEQSPVPQSQNEHTSRIYELIVEIFGLNITHHLYTVDSLTVEPDFTIFRQVMIYILQPLFGNFSLSTSMIGFLSDIFNQISKYMSHFSKYFLEYWFHFIQEFVFLSALPGENIGFSDFTSFSAEKVAGFRFFVKRTKRQSYSYAGFGFHQSYDADYYDLGLLETILHQKLSYTSPCIDIILQRFQKLVDIWKSGNQVDKTQLRDFLVQDQPSCKYCSKLKTIICRLDTIFTNRTQTIFSCYAVSLQNNLNLWFLNMSSISAKILTFDKPIALSFFTKRLQELCVLCEKEALIYSNTTYLAYPRKEAGPLTLPVHTDHAQCMICLEHEHLQISPEGWLICRTCQLKRGPYPRTVAEKKGYFDSLNETCNLCKNTLWKQRYFHIWSSNTWYHFDCFLALLSRTYKCSLCAIEFTNDLEKHLIPSANRLICSSCCHKCFASQQICVVCNKKLRYNENISKVNAVVSPFLMEFKTCQNTKQVQAEHYTNDIYVHEHCLTCLADGCHKDLSHTNFQALVFEGSLRLFCEEHSTNLNQQSFCDLLPLIETKACGRVFKISKARKWRELIQDQEWLKKTSRRKSPQEKGKPAKQVKFDISNRTSSAGSKSRFSLKSRSRSFLSSASADSLESSDNLELNEDVNEIESDTDKLVYRNRAGGIKLWNVAQYAKTFKSLKSRSRLRANTPVYSLTYQKWTSAGVLASNILQRIFDFRKVYADRQGTEEVESIL